MDDKTLLAVLRSFVTSFTTLTATYNPTQYNYIAWVHSNRDLPASIVLFAGTVLVLIIVMKARRAFGGMGKLGAFILFGLLWYVVWVLADYGFFPTSPISYFVWFGLFASAATLAIAGQWPSIRRMQLFDGWGRSKPRTSHRTFFEPGSDPDFDAFFGEPKDESDPKGTDHAELEAPSFPLLMRIAINHPELNPLMKHLLFYKKPGMSVEDLENSNVEKILRLKEQIDKLRKQNKVTYGEDDDLDILFEQTGKYMSSDNRINCDVATLMLQMPSLRKPKK